MAPLTHALSLPTLISILLLTSPTSAQSSPRTKRGLVDVDTRYTDTDAPIFKAAGPALSWYYNYGPTPSPLYASDTSLQFVPMLWGVNADSPSTDTTFLASITTQLDADVEIPYVLGFNEPDGQQSTGGSNIDPAVAAAAWQANMQPLAARGVKLGAPAVTGSPMGFAWLQAFFEACANCTADFIPVHWYGNFEGLASHLGQVRGTYPNMTVWVTEYALANAALDESQMFMQSSAEYFDRIDYITHYSYFGSFRSSVSNVGANAAMLTQDGKITDLGATYLNQPKQGNVPKARGAAGGRLSVEAGWLWGAVAVVGGLVVVGM
ncbi:MAG: hypothetical protein M1817_003416 [Caeruleum heppii]|nr:MAG: hypothetical protein M1817_003416 [Caeruleum heppii]